jgi:hypothetical protein
MKLSIHPIAYGATTDLLLILSITSLNHSLRNGSNVKNSDVTIGETGIEGVVVILGEAEGSAANLGRSSLLTIEIISSELVNELLGRQVINSDALLSTNDDPEDSGGEDDAVDGGLSVALIKMLSINEVPDVDLSVSSTGGEESGAGSDIEAVNLSLVANEGVHQRHGGVVPDLDGSIPRGRDDDRSLHVVVESDAGNPVGVLVLLNSELADTLDVPNLDLLVDGAGSNLPVVRGESDGHDVLGVTEESLSSLTNGEVPESDGAIPRGREGKSGVGGEIDVGDEVGVSLHDLLGLSVLLGAISVRHILEVPDDERSVSGTGEEELLGGAIGLLLRAGFHAGNPAVVALKETFV